MSFLSAAASCSSVSRGSDRERPLADDIPIIDAEDAEGSSRAVGPLSRESEQPAVMAFHEGLLESCKKKWCGSYEGV